MQEIHRLSEQCRTQAEEKQVCNLQIQQQQAEVGPQYLQVFS